MCKKILCVIVSLALLQNIACAQYEEVQTGDLLFVGLPLDYSLDNDTNMSDAIAASTGQSGEINYIHVAILEKDSTGQVWIIDATIRHGVDRHPIDTFLVDFTLKDGNLPLLVVMRLKHNQEAAQYVENAKQFCGRGYDVYFLPDNEEKYCSELVRDSYLHHGEPIFQAAPMNFKSADGSFPIYWVQLFDQLGQAIPQGVPGTNPNTMSKEKCLKRVGELKLGSE